MKHCHKLLCIIFCCMLSLTISMLSIEAKGAKKTPPGLEKKGGVPPGQAKKQGTISGQSGQQWQPPGQVKKAQIAVMKAMQKAQQTWCLDHQGYVNAVLSDKTICACLTETHAVAFASEKTWFEAIGKSLHHSLTTGKDAGIVLFVIKDTRQTYTFQLEAVIKRFNLPVTLWELEIEIEDDDDDDGEDEG